MTASRGRAAWLLLLGAAGCGTAMPPAPPKPPTATLQPAATPAQAPAPDAKDPCARIDFDDRSVIELEGPVAAGRYPEVARWPNEVLQRVRRALCSEAALDFLPAPRRIVRLRLAAHGRATLELSVGPPPAQWPVALVLERAPGSAAWRFAGAELTRARIRGRLMAVARWLQDHAEVELMSAQLAGAWWKGPRWRLARIKDAGGSTLCVLDDARGPAHCYRDPRDIEHIGHWLGDDVPAERDDDAEGPAPPLQLLLWPVEGAGDRTTEVWLFDTAAGQACRAGRVRPREPLPPNPRREWRYPGTRIPPARPSAPLQIDRKHCEPLPEVAAPDWAELVPEITISVVTGREGRRALQLSATTPELAPVEETVLCLRERGPYRCGVFEWPQALAYEGAAVVDVVGEFNPPVRTGAEVTSTRRIDVIEVDHWDPDNSCCFWHLDEALLYFLELRDGRFAQAAPELRIGRRERARGERDGDWMMIRDYAVPTVIGDHVVQLDLVMAESLRYRGSRLMERVLHHDIPQRRCMTRASGSFHDVPEQRVDKAWRHDAVACEPNGE